MQVIDAKIKALKGVIDTYDTEIASNNQFDLWKKFMSVAYETMTGNSFSGKSEKDFWKEWIAYFGTAGSETGNIITDHRKGFKYFLDFIGNDVNPYAFDEVDYETYNKIISEAYAIFLPQHNLLANYVMQNGELVDKVGGEGQELLFPCFEGESSSKYITIPDGELNASDYFETEVSFTDVTNYSYLLGAYGEGKNYLKIRATNIYFECEDNVNRTINLLESLVVITKYIIRFGFDAISGYRAYVQIDGGTKQYSSVYATPSPFKFDTLASGYYGGYLLGTMWNAKIYEDLVLTTYPLIGHAYGFTPTKVITGTPSDATCFEGLTTYNPEEGYNEGLECLANDKILYRNNNIAYGTFKFSLLKQDASLSAYHFINSTKLGIDAGEGYYFRINSAEKIYFYRNNIGSHSTLFSTSVEYIDANTNYPVVIHRIETVGEKFDSLKTLTFKSGEATDWLDATGYEVGNFAVLIDRGDGFELVQPDGVSQETNGTYGSQNGTSACNPVKDNTYTTSTYQVLDLDTGDKISAIKNEAESISVREYTQPSSDFAIDVIPQSHITPIKDINGAELVDFLGGNAMPPYAVYNGANLTGDFASAIQAIMLRNDDAIITDRDNQNYGYDSDNEYYWNVETLLRLPEFLKSLQTDWHLFMKVREDDKAIEQLIIYSATPSAINETQRLKILKATKDTTTDARDHEAYISCGELSTTGLKTGSAMLMNDGSKCEIGEGAEVIHSVSSDIEFTETANEPILQKDSNDKFYLDWSANNTKITSSSALIASHKYAQDENGDWYEITLEDTNNLELRKVDFEALNYKMYGFLSTDEVWTENVTQNGENVTQNGEQVTITMGG